MDDTFLFATVRQLAKLQYWATRALAFDHAQSVQRAQMAVREFAADVERAEPGVAWWQRIASELEQLNAEVQPLEKLN